MTLQGRVLSPGSADGTVLVLSEPLSFWGGFDAADGRIVDRHHPEAGAVLTGRILGLPEPWFWAAAYSAFCVFVEWFLNLGGHLVWEYPFWNRSFAGVWLIFLIGYFHFFAAIIIVLSLKLPKLW